MIRREKQDNNKINSLREEICELIYSVSTTRLRPLSSSP